MKRSKALEIIANHLYELNLDPEDADASAEALLNELEYEGIGPIVSVVSWDKEDE